MGSAREQGEGKMLTSNDAYVYTSKTHKWGGLICILAPASKLFKWEFLRGLGKMAQSVKCLLHKYNLSSDQQHPCEKAKVWNPGAEKAGSGESRRSLAR